MLRRKQRCRGSWELRRRVRTLHPDLLRRRRLLLLLLLLLRTLLLGNLLLRSLRLRSGLT